MDGDREVVPAPARYAFLDHPFVIPFAHRGGRGPHPENTAAAFQRAVDLGYRYLETDVRASRDDALVAFHDPSLGRMCGIPRDVRDLTRRELARAQVGGTEPIPLLEDLLGSWPAARFNIDVKHETAVRPLVDAIRRTAALDRVCVGSFSSRRVESVRRALGPRLCTSAGVAELAALRAHSYRRTTDRTSRRPRLPFAAAQVPPRARRVRIIDRRFVDVAHHGGMHVHAWTINTAAEIDALLDLGVDGVMTDELDVLKAALQRRDLWSE